MKPKGVCELKKGRKRVYDLYARKRRQEIDILFKRVPPNPEQTRGLVTPKITVPFFLFFELVLRSVKTRTPSVETCNKARRYSYQQPQSLEL